MLNDPIAAFRGFGGPPAATGTVHLVGSGPGDPGLLTLRAATLLATCDVVAHDRLSPAAVLDLVPDDAERICVGKRSGEPGTTRDEVDRLLISRARAGGAVVRLKGGDPFVFGRGGEEAQALAAADVPVEVVHGISSAVAVAGAAGIPVTHRGVATGFAVATAHEDPGKPAGQTDLRAMAAFPGTLVFLMGVRRLGRVVERLVEHGRPPDTPVAVVQWGTRVEQRTVEATLATVVARVRAEDVGSPAVIVVGDVVALRHDIGGRERRALHGVTVLLPRLGVAASRLAAAVRGAGAEVVEVEIAHTVPAELSGPAARVRRGGVDTVVVPSIVALDALMDALVEVGGDLRDLARVTLVTTGPRVVRELRARGLVADIAAASPAGLAEDPPTGLGRTLVLTTDGADRGVSAALEDAGASVEQVTAVRVEQADIDPGLRARAEHADVVLLPAAALAAPLRDAGLVRRPVVAAGPTSAGAARAAGLDVAGEVPPQDRDALIGALARAVGTPTGRRSATS